MSVSGDGSGDPPTFQVTDQMYTDYYKIFFDIPVLGASLNFAFLVLVAILYTKKKCREQLDRVSFRLLVAVSIGNFIYAVCQSIVASITDETQNKLCANSMFLLMFGLQFSSFMTFTIALNLFLVLILKKNGRTLEKYYYIVGVIFGLALSAPAYGLGSFGFEAVYETCWWNPPENYTGWQMGGQVAWTFLLAVLEFGLFIVMTIFLLRSKAASKIATQNVQGSYLMNYNTVIVRIGVYPIIGLCVNAITSFCDIYLLPFATIPSQEVWNIQTLSTVFYGLRPCLYPVAALVDPSLSKALFIVFFPLHARLRSSFFSSTRSKASTGQEEKATGLSDEVRIPYNVTLGSGAPTKERADKIEDVESQQNLATSATDQEEGEDREERNARKKSEKDFGKQL